jgi:hypothetical protein
MTPYWKLEMLSEIEMEMLSEIERESATSSIVFYGEKFFPFY